MAVSRRTDTATIGLCGHNKTWERHLEQRQTLPRASYTQMGSSSVPFIQQSEMLGSGGMHKGTHDQIVTFASCHIWPLIWFFFCRGLYLGDIDVDCFYIALLSALSQTHCSLDTTKSSLYLSSLSGLHCDHSDYLLAEVPKLPCAEAAENPKFTNPCKTVVLVKRTFQSPSHWW